MSIVGNYKYHWIVFLIVASVYCSEMTEAQQSWNNKPVTTATKRFFTATTTKSKRLSDSARKVVFPEDTEILSEKMPQQIPLSLLNELNEATDWSEFLKHVDNVTVVDAEGDHPYVYATWEVDGRSGAGQQVVERDASVPAKAAQCMPELQTVQLMANTDPSVLFYPTCTRVERCGGCCSSDLLVCEPTKTETIHFQVLKTQYAGGTRMKFAGKESVPIEKHTACKCQCRVKQSHCTTNQVYVPGACRCECSNIDDRNKCEAENQTRYWDSRNCVCRCRDNGTNQQCSTGFYFNEDVCRCEPWAIRRRDDSSFDYSHVLVEDTGRRPSLETSSNNNNNVPSARSIYKEEDNVEEEDKKSKPMERFHFANNWNKPRQQRTLKAFQGIA